MKKQLGILLALFFAGASITSVNAQSAEVSPFNGRFASVELQHHSNLSGGDVLANIRKTFQKQFANVELESWLKTNDGYAIRFNTGGIDNLVFYDVKANNKGQVRYYKSNYLPADIRFQVESAYFNYDILSVQEITFNKSITYLIAIEAKKDWKIIRVSEAGMDVYKQYRKG